MKPQVATTLASLIMLIACSAPPIPSQTPQTPSPTVFGSHTSSVPPPTITSLPPTSTPTPTPVICPPEAVEFYVIRLRLASTSNWARIQLPDADRYIATRILSTEGRVGTADLKVQEPRSLVLDLTRVDQQMSLQEPLHMAMTVDLAIASHDIDERLRIILEKGAWFETEVELFSVQGDSLLQLAHITRTAERAQFSVDLTPLSRLAPQRTQVPSSTLSRMAWAFYYGWYMPIYDWMWWANPKWTDRPLIEYDSSDRAAIQRQVNEATSAGIDGFAYEWLGPDDPDQQRNLVTLLDVAQGSGFRVLLLVDLSFLQGGGDPYDRTLAALRSVHRGIAQHPAYMRIDGKPVALLFATYRLPLQRWRQLFSQLEEDGLDGIYFADGSLADLSVFDSFYFYAINGEKDLAYTYSRTADAIRHSAVFDEAPRERLWAATVQTGFDNTPIVNDPITPLYGGIPDITNREGGDFYRGTWDAAIASNADWVFITTWNEYQENTQIEPSNFYGDQYLTITREYVDRWHEQGCYPN